MNVDQYVGGAEHAVLHLLYSRFFYKFFHDRGWVGGRDEPFERLFHQGMVLYNGEKMSKSRGNVIGIDETAERFGVDAMRLLLLYVTPPEDTSDWTDEGIIGRVRMLNRLWRACEPHFARAGEASLRELPVCTDGAEKALVRAVHVAAKSALDETLSRRFHYNATIAKFDEYLNALTALGKERPDSAAVRYAVHALPVLIAPFAPHVAEELWSKMGHTASVHLERYLEVDPRALELDEMTLVVQVNGKLRARIALPSGTDEATAVAAALADPGVRQHIGGKEIRKQIYVPGKLLNIVV
jgi:leucyl-tRNA synthetase